MKHTPGPWSVQKTTIYRAHPNYEWVATTSREIGGMPEDQELENNNAMLIAAAPELLAALEIAMQIVWKARKTAEEQVFFMHTDRLIAKAKGII
jgi:hypothetical protein